MKLRKIGTLAIAACMALSMALPASASYYLPAGFTENTDTSTTDITITAAPGEEVSTYKAWRILNLSTSLKTDVDHSAEGHVHTATCYNYAYSVNVKYSNALFEAFTENGIDTSAMEDGYDIIEYISTLGSDSAEIRALAGSLYKQITTLALDADEVSTANKFQDADQGYYLIAENTLAGGDDSRSLVMLDTKGMIAVSVTAKDDSPVISKKVFENSYPIAPMALEDNDTINWGYGQGWYDHADYAVGEFVPFQIKTLLPNKSTLDAYKTPYKLIFHDTLSTTLELDASSVSIRLDGVPLTKGTDYTVSDVAANGYFTITISDLMQVVNAHNITLNDTGSMLAIQYSAELLSTADTGNPGQDNKVKLEFSNDPYNEDSTAETVEDIVTVFTYSLVVNKVDANGNPLQNAHFKLQKKELGASEYTDFPNGTVAQNANATSFTFFGLDCGNYQLVETITPPGYNTAQPIQFSIVSHETIGVVSDRPVLTYLEIKDVDDNVLSTEAEDATFTFDLASGVATTKVVNKTGLQLPTTGGMGTYLFYGGGILLVVAGVFLVMKKRKDNDE